MKQRFRFVLPSRSMIGRRPRFDFSTGRRPTRLQTKSKMISDVKNLRKNHSWGPKSPGPTSAEANANPPWRRLGEKKKNLSMSTFSVRVYVVLLEIDYDLT